MAETPTKTWVPYFNPQCILLQYGWFTSALKASRAHITIHSYNRMNKQTNEANSNVRKQPFSYSVLPDIHPILPPPPPSDSRPSWANSFPGSFQVSQFTAYLSREFIPVWNLGEIVNWGPWHVSSALESWETGSHARQLRGPGECADFQTMSSFCICIAILKGPVLLISTMTLLLEVSRINKGETRDHVTRQHLSLLVDCGFPSTL